MKTKEFMNGIAGMSMAELNDELVAVFRQQCPKREKQTKLRKGGYCCGKKS